MKFRNLSKNQDGVTLIIAVVMLAAVTFISFSLSTIILRELKAGRLILRSEPAISGANTGGEIGLFRLIRELGSIDSTGSLPQSNVQYQITSDLFDNPYYFTVAPDKDTRVLLYDPTDTNNKDADYGTVTIANDGSPTHPIKYEIYSWSDPVNTICDGNIGVGQKTVPACALDYPGDDRYLIIIRANGNVDARGSITATNNLGASKGVPSDSPALDSTGSNGDVQRKIQINL